jgi:hypothetical protein
LRYLQNELFSDMPQEGLIMGSELPCSRLQLLGRKMMEENGFLGVPTESFEQAGRNQFVTLLEAGLVPESKVLDIGCGVLRLGYWLIRFLEDGGYCGIEPAEVRLNLGKKYLFSSLLLNAKKPLFDFNPEFDTGVFKKKFDFFLAGSIWTHCSKDSIKIMLDGFVENTKKSGVFLTSYLPADAADEDYQGRNWVGTSHMSNVAGCIKHSRSWIEAECSRLDLIVEDIDRAAFDGQYWLKITKRSY